MSTNFGAGKVVIVQEAQTLVAFLGGDRRQEQWIPNDAFASESIRAAGEEGEIVVNDDFIDGSNPAYPRVRPSTKLVDLRRARNGH